MNLKEWLFGKKQNAAPEATDYFRLLNGYMPVFQTWNGSVYESHLVRAAIDARARHISKLAVEVRGSANQGIRTAIQTAPNKTQTWSQFLYRLSTILDVRNTAFVLPVFDKYDKTVGYFTACPNSWELVTVQGEPWVRFRFDNAENMACELSRIGILTKYQYRNDLFGERNNDALADVMDLIQIQQQGIEEYAKNASSFRFYAKVSNFTKPDDLAKERRRFDAENFQQSNGGGVLLFPNTYTDIKQVSQQTYSVDASELELIYSSIYNYFGVNEDVLQNKATGDQLDAFFNGAIEPFAVQLSDVLTRMTFSEREIQFENKILVTANRLQYMSTSDKISLARDLGDRGFVLIDEIRELFNYPPLPDGQGQVSPIRGEYYTLQEGKNND